MAILILLVVAGASFLITSAILLFTSKIFKIKDRSFKKSMLIVFWSSISSTVALSVFSLIWAVVPENGITKIIDVILTGFIGAIIFDYFFQKYYSQSCKKATQIFIVYTLFSIIVSLIIIIPIRAFLFTPFYVKGDSMNPTYQNNDYLFVSLFNKQFSKGDIVIVRKKDKPNTFLIKRIIGTPGETIDGTILNDQQYFVMSDNRDTNVDNGVIEESEIFGKVIYKAWPLR